MSNKRLGLKAGVPWSFFISVTNSGSIVDCSSYTAEMGLRREATTAAALHIVTGSGMTANGSGFVLDSSVVTASATADLDGTYLADIVIAAPAGNEVPTKTFWIDVSPRITP